MSNSQIIEFALRSGERLLLEDRWDPLLYNPILTIDVGSARFEHKFEIPPPHFYNSACLRPGRHQIILPPGFNHLLLIGCNTSGITRGRYRDA